MFIRILLPVVACLVSAKLSFAEVSKKLYRLPSSISGFSSPLVADIDGNPGNGLEIVKTSADGVVHSLSSSGNLLWSSSIPKAECVGSVGNRIHSSPALGTLDRSGRKAVVVAFGGVGNRSCDGGVVAFDANNGQQLWFFSLKAFSKQNKFYSFRYSAFTTPALSDVNRDGLTEIAFGSFDRNVYLLNPDGKVRWYYNAADTVWASQLFLDINGDNKPELIAATDISANKKIKPKTPDGGYLYALRTDPISGKSKKIKFRDVKKSIWRSEVDQVLYSSPIAADVIPSNPGKEIIVASGCFFPQKGSDKRGKWIKIFDDHSGKLLRTLPTSSCSSTSPIAADIDDDGQIEVIAFIQGHKSVGGDGNSHVIAWKADSGQQLWNVIPRSGNQNQEMGGEHSSPVIADLDGNGSLEVIANNGNGLVIIDGKSGAILSCQEKSCGDKPSLLFGSSSTSTPTVADLDSDGRLELIAAASNGVHVWSGFSGNLNSAPGAQAAYSAPWPTWRGNQMRTGSN